MADRLAGIPELMSERLSALCIAFCTEVLANRGKSVGENGLPNNL